MRIVRPSLVAQAVVLKKRGQGQRECVEELDRLLPNSFLEKYLRGQISFRLWIT